MRFLVHCLAVACGSIVAGCGSDSATTEGPSAVASVVVTGAPALLLVGDSARLVGTATNATGGIVSNQQITWKSSNPQAAGISSNGTVVGLGAGVTTITASAGGRDGTAAIDVRAGGTVGTQGGTLTANAGTVTLTVPAGALPQATLVLMRPVPDAPADARLISSSAFEVGPDGLVFNRSATLTLKYDASKMPAGTVEPSLQLYVLSANQWSLVRFSTVNSTTKTVTGAVTRSGTYVVRSTPVDRILLSGPQVSGALYAGQTSQVSAKLLDVNGDSLLGRTVAWTTSDAGRATVDASGRVTALTSGDVTITASCDGKSSTATMSVLPRVVADWSRAGEWMMYQANPAHTGYIDATIDPTTFRERWVQAPTGGSALNAVAVGGSKVFVSTNGYFSAQKLFALDAGTGTQIWSRDFGPIFGVNAPTYSNGNVYVTTGGHEDTYLYSLDQNDGTLKFKTAFDSQWEHWRAPIVMGTMIFTAGGYYGGMYGFDLPSGNRRYFVSLPQVDGWVPAGANGTLYSFGYTAAGTAGLRAYDPATGKLAYEIPDSRLPTAGTPVLGGANNVLVTVGNRLVSIDLTARKIAWEQSGTITGSPVVNAGIVYVFANKQLEARRESDGGLVWAWSPSGGLTMTANMVLTNNILFVSSSATDYSGNATTYAVDLAAHTQVWSYPVGGELAVGNQNTLFIVGKGQVAAIAIK